MAAFIDSRTSTQIVGPELSRLKALTRSQRLAFALLTSDRMFSAIAAYAAIERSFDPSVYTELRELLWRQLCGEEGEAERAKVDWSHWIEKAIEDAPNTEARSSEYVSYALNAALALAASASLCASDDPFAVEELSGLALDSVYSYAIVRDGAQVQDQHADARAKSSACYQAELRKQVEDIDWLANLPSELDIGSRQEIQLKAQAQGSLLDLQQLPEP